MKKLLLFIVALPLIYCGIWFYAAHKIKSEVHHIYEREAPKNGYKLLGDAPKVTGFPGKHIISVNTGIEIENTKLTFDSASIKTIPLAGQPLEININNLAIYDPLKETPYEIFNVNATLIPPKNMPTTLTEQDLLPWQKLNQKINIKHLHIEANDMHLTSNGFAGLDSALQPNINLQTKMTGYIKLVEFITKNNKNVSPIAGAIAMSVLNGMAKEDPATGEKFVEFDLVVKDRALAIGPVKAIKVPKIYWPKE